MTYRYFITTPGAAEQEARNRLLLAERDFWRDYALERIRFEAQFASHLLKDGQAVVTAPSGTFFVTAEKEKKTNE
jgi:hypothetical protein